MLSNSPLTSKRPVLDLHIEATYRLTEALVASEERMRRRLDLLAEVVFETDDRGALVFLNQAWTGCLGYQVDACLGKPLAEYVAAEDQDLFGRIMEGSGEAGVCLRLRHSDGYVRWIEASVSLLPDGGAVGALHDVTAKREVEDQIAKLSLVASFTDEFVLITDRYGFTEWVNQAFVRRTGYTLAKIKGRKPGSLLQGAATDPQTVELMRHWTREGRSFQAEVLNYTRKGEPYWVAMRVTPVRGRDGEVERFVAVATDFTALHKAGVELRAAKERAEAANIAKTEFVAMSSHEMRTPLNAILGSVSLAMDPTAGHGEIQDHLRRIESNAETLLRFISDMMDWSKVEVGQFTIERAPVSLRDCLMDVLASLAQNAQAKGLAFHVTFDESLPPRVMADPDRLRQIVANLTENAIKFTESGEVRVAISRVDYGLGGKPSLELRVTDTGPGIAEQAQGNIFQRFERVHTSATHGKSGVGLGLYIVKGLAEALGGSVSVSSAEGEGSDFRVSIPLDLAPETAVVPGSENRPPVVANGAAANPPCILVAEDTNANFAILEIFLSKAGYRVVRALNGLEAVVAAESADLILMDIEMPEMDGLEASVRIRETERLEGRAAVPIVALTGHTADDYLQRCLDAGCTGFLTKPVRREVLLQHVLAALGHTADGP